MAPQSEALHQFCDLLQKFQTGTLVTHSGNGALHGRPMAVAQVEPLRHGCDLWFVTGLDTPKMDEIRSNDQVLVAFQNRNDQFLTLSGRADMVQDPEKTEELWGDSLKLWFPQGQSDPNLILLRVRAEHGDYWDRGNFTKFSFALGAAESSAQTRGLGGAAQPANPSGMAH
ncbi:pyridoxamine 5'-phosphate oxidase family protein [Vampirovibrio sp.]|uniref:pyridoxamine 5'-phosphate oxidase family protein n=1 Tax=Vampirovibrio sp. TaxID=2717857 RepID=UPI0035931888